MDCICPYCGRKIKNGNFGFDLTDYIRDQLLMSVGYPGMTKQTPDPKAGIKALFSGLSKKDHLISTEREIYGWKRPAGLRQNMVMMEMPYVKICSLFNEYGKGDSQDAINIRGSADWIKNNYRLLSAMCFPLILDKEADGDILFNQIRTDFDERPIVKHRVCPECGDRLSFWSGRYKEICLGVLGGPRVSKTTTLTACASAFMDNGGHKGINWTGSKMDPNYIDFEKDCLEQYRKGLPLKATVITEQIPRVSFCVTIYDTVINHLTDKMVLTFVDLPGELNNETGINDEFYARYSHYFENVNYIWYCTDPAEILQLAETAEKSDKVKELGYEVGESALSLNDIVSNMMKVSSIFNHSGRSIPVIYILGKTDASLISPMEKFQYHLYAQNPGAAHKIAENPFNVKYFNEEAIRVRTYMQTKNPSLIANFEQYFPNHCYIAFSAYGFNPVQNERNGTTCPPRGFNLAAPFMWMMTLESGIKLNKTRKTGMFKKKYENASYYLNRAPKNEAEKDYRNLFIRGPYLE